jgi:cystathionine beta-lyase/cystathionine gamma-synthase
MDDNVIAKMNGELHYLRNTAPKRNLLAQNIAKFYEQNKTFITCSGMNSIYIALCSYT